MSTAANSGPLTVTSPLTRGTRVGHAQQLLHTNAFQADYLQDTVDGVFGEATGRACRRAKFWLGYPDARLSPVFGDELARHLHKGSTSLPLLYRTRRASRLRTRARQQKARPKLTLGAHAFAALAGHAGLTESPPGSNRCLFSLWYGIIGPWCAMSVTWAYTQVGSAAFRRGSRYAYVPYLLADARAGRNHLAVTREPRRGDPVCFDWNSDGIFDHVGLFDRWVDRAHGTFKTLEGNTSSDDHGSQSNGGGLFHRTRSLEAGYRAVFVRVGG